MEFEDDIYERNPSKGKLIYQEEVTFPVMYWVNKLKNLDTSIQTKYNQFVQSDELTKAQEARQEAFSCLGVVIDKHMKNIMNGFNARIEQCYGHTNIASFDYCVSPLFNAQKLL